MSDLNKCLYSTFNLSSRLSV